MRPLKMTHPGQSGRTLGTGAARVNREFDCFNDSRFSPQNQAYSRLNFSESISPNNGYSEPDFDAEEEARGGEPVHVGEVVIKVMADLARRRVNREDQ